MPEDPDAAATLIADLVWALGATGKFVWPIPDKGLKKRMHRIKAKALIVWGEDDALVSSVYANEFAARIAEFPGRDHQGLRTRAASGAARNPQAAGGELPRRVRQRRAGSSPGPMASSRKSGCCSRVNSTAKPSSRWRTTRPGTLPSVTSAPIGGRWSVATPAPDCDTSMIRQLTLRPLGRIRRVIGLRGIETAVAAVFGQIEDVAVGEPGQLGGEFVALARRRRYRHGKAALKDARDVAFEAAQMIDIGDDAFAGLAAHRRDQGHAAGRHIHDLAGEFPPVGQHVAAEEVDADPLKSPALFAERAQSFFC